MMQHQATVPQVVAALDRCVNRNHSIIADQAHNQASIIEANILAGVSHLNQGRLQLLGDGWRAAWLGLRP